MAGQLLCADYVFNGYGTTKRDFMKQIRKSQEDGHQSRFLPADYKFTHRTGTKIQGKAVWAYPLSGVLEDMVPLTPGSHSSGRGSQLSIGVSDSKLTMDHLG